MKEKLTNNLNLKIFAVLFAAGLWLISMNINDPNQTKEYSVNVQLQNVGVMTSTGKYVEVVNDSDEITVKVRGNRSVMDSFLSSNILATADLSKIDENNRVPIEVEPRTVNGKEVVIVNKSSENIEVKVENIRKIQKSLEVVTKNVPKDGYILGKVSTQQNALRISGPESVVALVDKAVVNFDLQNATDDVSMILPIELYDAEGTRITDSRLTTSINEVQCVATVLATKEIPFVVTAKGTPERGYGFTGEIIYEPQNVLIAAKSQVLRRMSKFEITDAIDLQGAKESVSTSVDVREYLPDDVMLADQNFDGKVQVTAVVDEIFTEEVKITGKQIQIVNVPDKISGAIKDLEDEITVSLIGFVSEKDNFDEKDVKAKVDILSYMNKHNLIKLKPGTYEMDVRFDLPEGISTEDEIQVQVKISEK